jgi:hypothetical protein
MTTSTNGYLDSEDKRKIHAEINQIVNQRLSLMVLAITVFGVFIAWLTPKQTPTEIKQFVEFVYFGSSLLLIILFLIFLVTHQLAQMLRVFSTYLRETQGSVWEEDWARFRKNYTYIGYTKPQSMIFLFLGLLTTIFPVFLIFIYTSCIEPNWGLFFSVGLGIIYMIFVFGMGFKKCGDNEKRYEKRWKEIIKLS